MRVLIRIVWAFSSKRKALAMRREGIDDDSHYQCVLEGREMLDL